MNNRTKSAGDVATGAVVGGAAGGVAGLLYTLIKGKPTLKKSLKNMLIGGTGGAAIGAGTSALHTIKDDKPNEESKPSRAPEPKAEAKTPRSMDKGVAAASALLPGAGPAAHGLHAGGVEQAARSGGRSLLEGFAGAMAGNVATGKLMKNKESLLLGGLGGLAGLVHGSVAAADNFNEREKGAAEELSVRPWSASGGAIAGGAAGAGLGGITGLLRAAFDSEDDGLMSTIQKTLGGALNGGAIGGIAGGVGGHLLNRDVTNRMMKQLPMLGGEAAANRRRNAFSAAASRVRIPVKPAFNHLTGQSEPGEFNKAINKSNVTDLLLTALGPSVVNQAYKK